MIYNYNIIFNTTTEHNGNYILCSLIFPLKYEPS